MVPNRYGTNLPKYYENQYYGSANIGHILKCTKFFDWFASKRAFSMASNFILKQV